MATEKKLRNWLLALGACAPFIAVVALNYALTPKTAKQGRVHHGIKAIPPHGTR